MRKTLCKTLLNLYSFAVECDSLYTKHRDVFHFAIFLFLKESIQISIKKKDIL